MMGAFDVSSGVQLPPGVAADVAPPFAPPSAVSEPEYVLDPNVMAIYPPPPPPPPVAPAPVGEPAPPFALMTPVPAPAKVPASSLMVPPAPPPASLAVPVAPFAVIVPETVMVPLALIRISPPPAPPKEPPSLPPPAPRSEGLVEESYGVPPAPGVEPLPPAPQWAAPPAVAASVPCPAAGPEEAS